MKMRYILGTALCILLATGWYLWDSGILAKKQEAAFLVPQNALLFAEQKDIGALIENVQKSRLGKALAAIDYQQVGREVGLSDDNLSDMQQTLEVIKELSHSKLFLEFCGKSVALALLPMDSADSVGTAMPPRYPVSALLIAKPQHKAEIFELISSIYSGNVQQAETIYGNFTVKRLQVEDATIFAAIVDGFFLLSMDEQTLHRALDVSRQSEKSLAKNASYQKLKNQFKLPEFLIFFSSEGLRQKLAEVAKKESPDLQQEFVDQLTSTSGLQYSAYGIWRDKGLLRDLFITLVDPAKLNPLIGQILSTPPQHNDTLDFVPENIVSYYWSNTFALNSLWKMYVETDKNNVTEIDKFKTQFKEKTGREVTEVLAMIDGGMSILMKKGDPKSFLPLPHFAVFIKLKDRKAVEDLLHSIMVKNGIPMETTTYKKITYSSYGLSLQDGLEGLYGFHDNFLFLANSSETMRDIIDTIESGKGLKAG